MNRGKKLLAGLCVVAVIAGGIASREYIGAEYRYRITVEVETSEGIRAGSSVIAIRLKKRIPFGNYSGGILHEVTGEAVAVDLPNGQTLFALLSKPGQPDSPAYLMRDIALDYGIKYDQNSALAEVEAIKSVKESVELLADNQPTLVRFRDINDPKTVEKADPDNLAASLGAGVKLKQITVEITDDPITTGIKQILPEPPFVRSYYYHGEESTVLNLYNGKLVSEVIDIETFIKGNR